MGRVRPAARGGRGKTWKQYKARQIFFFLVSKTAQLSTGREGGLSQQPTTVKATTRRHCADRSDPLGASAVPLPFMGHVPPLGITHIYFSTYIHLIFTPQKGAYRTVYVPFSRCKNQVGKLHISKKGGVVETC